MTKSNYLREVLEELSEDKKEVEALLSENLSAIREIELYLSSLFEKENTDYELFSPRNVQSVYKEKIEESNQIKDSLEEKNIALYQKINRYDQKMVKLTKVLETIEEKIEEKTEEAVRLAKKQVNYTILDIQEKERQRIARDLHDSTVQNLTYLIHKIELSSKFIDQDIIRAKMELLSANKNIKDIINDMRNIIFNLRPMEFDDMGMKAALERLFLDLQEKTEMRIVLEIVEIPEIAELYLASIFHIIQECSNNAIKHSQGTELKVIVNFDEKSLFIIIEDDGIGFDSNKKEDRHFGLSMTKERISLLSGTMQLVSNCNKGTKISITLPRRFEGSI